MKVTLPLFAFAAAYRRRFPSASAKQAIAYVRFATFNGTTVPGSALWL